MGLFSVCVHKSAIVINIVEQFIHYAGAVQCRGTAAGMASP